MKISEAIALLQKQDPEADLCVYNHEFNSWDTAEMLVRSDGGDFMFSDEDIAFLDAERTPTEVTHRMLDRAEQHVEYCHLDVARAIRHQTGVDQRQRELRRAEARLAQLRALAVEQGL